MISAVYTVNAKSWLFTLMKTSESKVFPESVVIWYVKLPQIVSETDEVNWGII